MRASNYDVVVVGAGAAGLTAAIGLARAGFAVAVVEAAAFPGAENWSGCVYFCENLADPDLLGPDGVEALAWERRLVERGFFACDGHSLLGLTYRDPEAFRYCYTVLRPIYDHHLGQVALQQGVTLLTHTTAESLIREGGRVAGVCTQRGALYADLVFLAEGDASHLVTREGYERFTDQREKPKFLHGIKQVIDLPPGAVEERFGVGPEEGAAYEFVLRNGTLRGRSVVLNMGGFVYTNRQSLSIGLVLPADNLTEHFGGDPSLLIEWFENLPALRPWFKDGRRGVFGAKLIRGGGARDIPHLIDDGLAIGGAASAIGIDFPYPNFTGPATGMGLLLVRAARAIRAEGGDFTRANLQRHYLEPLQRTAYWQDVEFLRHWPGYVKATRCFFERSLDLALGSAYIWTQAAGPLRRWTSWLRLLRQVAGPGQWRPLLADWRHLQKALRLREVVSRPALGRLLLDGGLNALRDLSRHPRANLPSAGTLRLLYRRGEEGPFAAPPALLGRWFERFTPVLAAAARKVYANDGAPLAVKLPGAVQLLTRQFNILDLLVAGGTALASFLSGAVQGGWDRCRRWLRFLPQRSSGFRPHERYQAAVRQATDLTPSLTPAAAAWEARLAQLAYQTAPSSHIRLNWPQALTSRKDVVKDGLWHVCPAHVYEARTNANGQLQLVVNYENCIKCETCWRTTDLADWGRDGRHTFIYPVHSPAVARLLEAAEKPLPRPRPPRCKDHWQATICFPAKLANPATPELAEVASLLAKLDRKLEQFDEALAAEPRTVDRARAEYLETLARYTQQLAGRLLELVRNLRLVPENAEVLSYRQRLVELAKALATKMDERARHTWDRRFAWAAADGRQIRFHHLAGLRHGLQPLLPTDQLQSTPPSNPWLRGEATGMQIAGEISGWRQRLDAAFDPYAWRQIDRGTPLTEDQDRTLRELLAAVPRLDANDPARTLHPPLRKALLAELGGRDPSLAYRVACHLWARDLASLAPDARLRAAAERWARGETWAAFVAVEGVQGEGEVWRGEALFVPAVFADDLLVALPDRLAAVPIKTPGLYVEPLATLGLRGAGLARVRLDNLALAASVVVADQDRVRRVWRVLSSADLIAIALGMADQLQRRCVVHATTRVQFPGLFHDEEARDAIGKFGAVKKMIAELATRRFLLQTLDAVLTPADFSAASAERAELLKALAAEALGTAPGSITYNAGQIFGGTGFSEDDILAKFYRDAAAWRFVGVPNVEAFNRHGDRLLKEWRLDGRRLAAAQPDEPRLFDEVAQRKALQSELDELRVQRSRLRALVNDWLTDRQDPGTDGPDADAESCRMAEGLARQDAHLLAGKALLLRIHARHEQGLDAELDTALLRVWLDYASQSLDDFEALMRSGPRRGAPSAPVAGPQARPAITRYAEYLSAPIHADSGDFLIAPVDLARPRLVPELIETDPELAARDAEIRRLFNEHFGRPRPDGLPYERHLEHVHRPEPEDLDFLRRHGFLRMPIPRELGGAGRPKVDYYLLTTNAQRLADFAIALTIQVNTSIGTTPILVARDKDLPRACQELAPFAAEVGLRHEIQTELEKLAQQLEPPTAATFDQAYRRVHQRLEEPVLAKPAVRIHLHRFLQAWSRVGSAAQARNVPALRASLSEAVTAWKETGGRAEEALAELNRRREACDLALRWIAAGQISGFALTEPSAGSDSARVATRARLVSVPVQVEPDGVLTFVPVSGQQPRHLLDARRLVFEPDGVRYRWSDQHEPTLLHFDEYDYETDNPAKTRYYQHGNRRVAFTDIAQLRERDGRLWYDYWELNGAKMWITNGRMAGLFCLYAKTEEGVTGFIVDRHAEGLVVGKDEDKMGQCGSPTNELSLQAVRVPRENVLGLEGRGQVNALETLNVGRAGLAMSAMAQMAGLIDSSRAFARAAYGKIPAWVAVRLHQMEEDRFTAEALAFDTIGRFEHPGTKSVRLESAISKMLVSELLHRVIERAEEIHGLAGQTQVHLIEKRKRDARVLNIYEGTNEVQRFFILKDLASEVAPRWSETPSPLPNHLGREALEFEAVKSDLRQRTTVALRLFGQDLWQNPNLQANCFLLAEAVAWLKAADSTLGRLAWLDQQAPSEDGELSPRLESGRQALAACLREIRNRLRRFDEELTHLRRGFYAPEVRAASLLFDRAEALTAPVVPPSLVTRPLAVLVVVEPTASDLPQLHTADGRLSEPHFCLTAADRAALEAALRLRDQAQAPVRIEVLAVGPRRAAQPLREVLALGADRVRLLVTEAGPVSPDTAARALATLIADHSRPDLVLGGDSKEGQEGLLARLTAASLAIPFAGQASCLVVRAEVAAAQVDLLAADMGYLGSQALPAAIALTVDVQLRAFTLTGYLSGLDREVELLPWPDAVTAQLEQYEAVQPAGPREAPKEADGNLAPETAASRLLAELGKDLDRFAASQPYTGPLQEGTDPARWQEAVVAVLRSEHQGRLLTTAPAVLAAARSLAAQSHRPGLVLLFTPGLEETDRLALGKVIHLWQPDAVVVVPVKVDATPELLGLLLVEQWPKLVIQPRAVVSEAWAESAMMTLAQQGGPAATVALRVRRLVYEQGRAFVESSRSGGKLRVRRPLPDRLAGSVWLTLTSDAEIGGTTTWEARQPQVGRHHPPLEPFIHRQDIQRLLAAIKREVGVTSLAEAEFIVDVGFGIGNRDGYETVIEPLVEALRQLGVRGLSVGGSRKVTEELRLLPHDRQIGQSGVRVNPLVLLAVGISGAPQHLNYIGPRATVVAFNRDPEAPLMTLNQRQPRPRVLPVVGDLFETVPAFTAALRQEARLAMTMMNSSG